MNDWVYDKSFTPSNFPCRIYSIEGRYPRRDKDFNDKPLIDVWVGDGFLSSHIENIEPIPLTEEILQKNFPKADKVAWWFADDYEDAYDRLTYEVHISGGALGINGFMWYVHELQHALRLCGLNEFADNFKI